MAASAAHAVNYGRGRHEAEFSLMQVPEDPGHYGASFTSRLITRRLTFCTQYPLHRDSPNMLTSDPLTVAAAWTQPNSREITQRGTLATSLAHLLHPGVLDRLETLVNKSEVYRQER